MDETERFKRIVSKPQTTREKWLDRQQRGIQDHLRRMVVSLQACRTDGLINDKMTLPQIIETLTKECES